MQGAHFAMSEHVSEEVDGDIFSMFTHVYSLPVPDDMVGLFNQSFEQEMNVEGECSANDLLSSIGSDMRSNEFDTYLPAEQVSTPDEGLGTYHGLIQNPLIFPSDDCPRLLKQQIMSPYLSPAKSTKTTVSPIPLSRSVGIGQPQIVIKPSSHEISILNELEEFFRPRYKSDYFAQNGKSRKPRYITDRKNNHYISVKVPTNVRGRLRIDWLTIQTANGDRYSMPYRFQASNEVADIPDCNPIYVDIDVDSKGIMKLYLVLIKSKQDELKSLQPLKPFQPFQEAFGRTDKNSTKQVPHMTPKNLIQTYQLDKSQLAFTFCSIAKDGVTNIPEWNTTVFSTVLTELSPEASRQKMVSCPKCSEVFHVSIPNSDEDRPEEPMLTKRKSIQSVSDSLPMVSMKKQRSYSD